MSGLHLRATLAERGLEVELSVAPGEVVALLGPNGSGKSTVLALAAGLLAPDTGRITLDGEVLTDTDTGVQVPPHRRGVVLLAQQALLFPHLSVAANVAFAPRSRGLSRSASRVEAARWLRAVDADGLASRTPSQLSGGQAQRVAVARALAAEPRLLLLDEPMEALDVAAAPVLRQLLRTVLRTQGRSALLVTHDVLDALVLADRVVVLESGRVVESGPTRRVLSRPRSAFAARVAGLNLVAGTAGEGGLRTAEGVFLGGEVDPDCVGGQPVVAVFSPSAVAVHRSRPAGSAGSAGSPGNAVEVVVASVEPRGEQVRVRAVEGTPVENTLGISTAGAGLMADVSVSAAAELELVPGVHVWFAVSAAQVVIHPG